MPATSSEPLYRQVSQGLLQRIQAGEWAVGTVLPKEVDLAKALGISRMTLRQALHILEKNGVVQRQKKVGTRVIAERPVVSFVQHMDGLSSSLRLAGQTAMRIDDVRTLQDLPDQGLHGFVSATGHWLAVAGVRRLQGSSQPCTCSTVYLDHKYAGIVPLLQGEVDSVCGLVERVYSMPVHSIRHRISACVLQPDQARTLSLPLGAAGLQVQAWLHAQDGSLIEYVRSVHNPALICIELSSDRNT